MRFWAGPLLSKLQYSKAAEVEGVEMGWRGVSPWGFPAIFSGEWVGVAAGQPRAQRITRALRLAFVPIICVTLSN